LKRAPKSRSISYVRRNKATGTEEAPSDKVATPGGMSAGGARASPPALPGPGDLVLGGKFRIDESLGKGGMGVVMAGEHITLGQKVAFKFLKPGASEADVVERFVREARAAARIDNEHVVRVSDVGVLESGVAYMVMERLEGEDLGRYLRRQGPLPVDEAVLYLAQACDAVAAAHAAGVIHRDLKPSNLFLARRRDGRSAIKVLDFGISKASSTSRDEVSQSLTRPGTVLGSPRYMSPEQVRDIRHVDGRSDVWSLGTVLYELLVGSPMYEGDTVQALYALIIADPPAPLRSKRPGVPAEIEAAVA
jgi:eukaryotic-like serine/threonine-protein kinase